MSNNLPRGLPWIDWDEWTTVKNCMYSKELKDQISALECVAVWRLRGKLPHSVESTAQLLEVLHNLIIDFWDQCIACTKYLFTQF